MGRFVYHILGWEALEFIDGRSAKGGVATDYFQYLVPAKASEAMGGFNII